MATLTYLAASDIDYLDPGQDYYTFGFMVQNAVNRALYSYKPDNSIKPVPDLAEGAAADLGRQEDHHGQDPQGRQVRAPVNREVKAADIKYAFERAFSKNVPSGYAGAYFQSIVGAPKANTGPIKPISGITTPDDNTIVFKLKEPQAPLVSQALVMPITVPVPKEYAAKYDKKVPSDVRQLRRLHRPVHGQERSQDGQGHRPQPGKLDRDRPQPELGRDTDYRPAYLDTITIQEGNNDLATASRRALSGAQLGLLRRRLAAGAGAEAGPAAQQEPGAVRAVRRHALHRVQHTIKPFDNINVRKAIIAASNRNALRQTRGGPVLGDIANGWIPPGIPGFEEAGGLKQNTNLDFLKNPGGDPAVAKKYMPRPSSRTACRSRQRQVHRREQDPDHRNQRRSGQEDR